MPRLGRGGLQLPRFFAGLSLPRAAAVLGISPTTADRHWAYARAFLYHEIHGAAD